MRASILYQAAPITGRVNEDAYYLQSDSQTLLAAVIDGASVRKQLPSFNRLVAESALPPKATIATYAARLTKDFIRDNPTLAPRDLLSKANLRLRQQLEEVLPINAEAFIQDEPTYRDLLQKDPRFIRLMLPACVATVLKIDFETQTANYAHVGDTALICYDNDGSAEQLTTDQMGKYDEQALQVAVRLKAERNADHISDVTALDEVRSINTKNGLYHNYVAENGLTDIAMGVGVIDGLLEMDDYIEEGTFNLTDIDRLLLCSDGIPLPTKLGETSDLVAMGNKLKTLGLQGYYNYLRDIESKDVHRDEYPRFKVHDDATAIFLEFAPP